MLVIALCYLSVTINQIASTLKVNVFTVKKND